MNSVPSKARIADFVQQLRDFTPFGLTMGLSVFLTSAEGFTRSGLVNPAMVQPATVPITFCAAVRLPYRMLNEMSGSVAFSLQMLLNMVLEASCNDLVELFEKGDVHSPDEFLRLCDRITSPTEYWFEVASVKVYEPSDEEKIADKYRFITGLADAHYDNTFLTFACEFNLYLAPTRPR